MSGIYIHIPFCKQACHYCDFHFSTVMAKKDVMIKALCKELVLRKDEFKEQNVETIYFGGGTPSVLDIQEISSILDAIHKHYKVIDSAEITLEANPDDLTEHKIKELSISPINRLSIGVQSFFEEDLKIMNRSHSVEQAVTSLTLAKQYFDNISIDLIYGMPHMTHERWKENINKAIALKIPHISSYALTIEPKTALAKFVEKGIVQPLADGLVQEQFTILSDTLTAAGYVSYEISNFGKPGYFSKNNSAYWQQKKYMGIGPSAHSFNGERRGWNTRNNTSYIKVIEQGNLPIEIEVLSKTDKYNEYIMTGLRTIWGVSLTRIASEFGKKYREYALLRAKKYIAEQLLYIDGDTLLTSKKGMFLVDGIAADLFMLEKK